MKTGSLLRIAAVSFLSLSACLQPASTSPVTVRPQTAGPLALDGDRTGDREPICRTEESAELLSKIDDAAEALFQILKTDADDLNTVHERATRLAEYEREYSENFSADCAGPRLTSENIALRIEKLVALANETDAAVIQSLAALLWDLYHSSPDA